MFVFESCLLDSLKSLTVWMHALLAAAITGGASGITAAIADPVHFNFHDGMKPLTSIVAVNAVLGIAAVLKQSPLPSRCQTPSK